jgi:predicted ATPase/class 3 adenylate cyclase
VIEFSRVTGCPACSFEIQPGFAYCPRCGAPQPSPCPGCGFACARDFRSCPRCGGPLDTPLAAAAPAAADDADRRPATVLFADLAGFTALASRLDPEDVRALQTDLFREASDALEHLGGFVEKFVGDAVVAVFGAPVAHEDDPERALRAALALHARMRDLSHRWQGRLGRPLALHIGVNTGPVVAGQLGRAASYTVSGDTVNVASRLLDAAAGGETLVSHATYALTRHAFAFEPLPAISVKGKAAPLAVYRLRAASRARSARGLEAHGLSAPLVGRDRELADVLAAFERAVAGRAQIVRVVGEAGAGKSRLDREALARLAVTGARPALRQATCSSLGEATYGVLAAFLRHAYDLDVGVPLEEARARIVRGLVGAGGSEEEAAVLAPLVGHILGRERGRAMPGEEEPEQIRRRILVATRTLVERRLQKGPVVLLVEDAHWADTASLEVLRFLVHQLADRPLVLLVTHRPDFDPRRLDVASAEACGVTLAPLTTSESEAVLRGFFGAGVDRWPRSLRDLVTSRAGGNPLFLEEIARGLLDAGVLAQTRAGWQAVADVERVEVPPTLQALLLARLDRLPGGARRLLQEAAVLGHEFAAALLRAMTAEPAGVDATLDLLAEAELIDEAPSATGEDDARRYRFRHALFQEVVYENVLQRRRAELHERAGRALERLTGEQPERLEDLEALGRHFVAGGEAARGARYLLAAGDRARAVYANDAALAHYRRALEALDRADDGEADRIAVRERLGDVLALTGERQEAREQYEAALARLAARSDAAGQARVHRKLGWLHWHAGDRDRALAECRAGLALLEGHQAHVERSHLLQEMGRMAFRAGDNERALAWAQQALAEALAVAGPEGGGTAAPEVTMALVDAYNTLGIALARAGRRREAVAHVERSAALAEAAGLLHAACRSYSNLGVLYSTLDPRRAIETCRRGLDTATRTGDVVSQSRLYANLAVAYCALTNRCDEDGVRAARSAIELDRRLGLLDHLAVPLIVLAQIHQCHGQPRLAREHFEEALALAEQAGDPQLLFPCYDGLAALHLELGDDARADDYLARAQAVCERAGLDPDSLVVLPFLE